MVVLVVGWKTLLADLLPLHAELKDENDQVLHLFHTIDSILMKKGKWLLMA